jgi:hypothetical protein
MEQAYGKTTKCSACNGTGEIKDIFHVGDIVVPTDLSCTTGEFHSIIRYESGKFGSFYECEILRIKEDFLIIKRVIDSGNQFSNKHGFLLYDVDPDKYPSANFVSSNCFTIPVGHVRKVDNVNDTLSNRPLSNIDHKKIATIKLVRDMTHMGLKEAKDLVEAIMELNK